MSLPDILNIGFKPDEKKLWALEIPVEKINITEIEYNLDIPYLERQGTNDWNLSPRQLIEDFNTQILHAKKIEEADLKYPIELYRHKDIWIILDGVYRFTKAILLGHTTIQVRRILPEVVQKIKVSNEEYRKWRG